MLKSIYLAAALFNGRETVFNQLLTQELEQLGNNVILPQRDGFEFVRLESKLQNCLSASDAKKASQIIIYLLDIGWFIKRSTVIIANLDEPADEGVVTEMVYGKMFGKKVIGFRTDVRSPFGDLSDSFRGGHFFPAYQAHAYVSCFIPSRTSEELKLGVSKLANKLCEISQTIPDCKVQVPKLAQDVACRAKHLFSLIDDLHSASGIKSIVARYVEREKWFLEIIPKVISLQ